MHLKPLHYWATSIVVVVITTLAVKFDIKWPAKQPATKIERLGSIERQVPSSLADNFSTTDSDDTSDHRQGGEKNALTGPNEADEPEIASTNTTTISVADIQSYADIVAYIEGLTYIEMGGIQPLVDQLLSNQTLRTEWYSGLLGANSLSIPPGTSLALSRMPKTELVSFLQQAFTSESPELKAFAIENLWMRDDINPIDDQLIASLDKLLPSPDSPYAYLQAIDILTAQPTDRLSSANQRTVSILTNNLYDTDHRIRFSSINGLSKMSGASTEINQAILNEISHRDIDTRHKALSHLDYWLENGYEPGPHDVEAVVNQIFSDINEIESLDESYMNNVAYIISELPLTNHQTQKLQAVGLFIEDPQNEQHPTM